MNVAVIGYGIDGKVSADYWLGKGDTVTICDQKSDLVVPEVFLSRLGPDHLKNLHEFDLIVRTPGIRPSAILDANADHPEIKERITTNLNEFLRVCPSEKVIGITGTKGKGTTSTVLTKILQTAGLTAHLGGNIGIAALEMLPKIQPTDFVVLELSSFQLMDLDQRIPTAACLMMAPEHLNWHTDLAEYHEAKAQLFKMQQPGDTAVYNANSEVSKQIASSGPGSLVAYAVPKPGEEPTIKEAAYVSGDNIYYKDQLIMPTREVKMLGRHNLENICAAITLAWPFIDGNLDAIRTVASTFSGLYHHMEYVDEIDGVKYYNDSYSTMPDATIAALQAVPEMKILVLGGFDKMLPLDNMVAAVAASNVRHVVLIGSLAERLKDMLAAQGFTDVTMGPNDMPGIVTELRAHAEPGDAILLSPGCAAKGDGYFIDNVDRGNQFKAAIASLRN